MQIGQTCNQGYSVEVKKIGMEVEPKVNTKEASMYSKTEDKSQEKSGGHDARQVHLDSAPPQHTSNSPYTATSTTSPQNTFTTLSQHSIPHNTSSTLQHHTCKARVAGFWGSKG